MNIKLASKILLSIFVVSTISVIIITWLYYLIVKTHLEDAYYSRYSSLGSSISNSFVEMDKLSDTINYNAAKSFALMQKNDGLPSDRKLSELAKSLGIQGIYVINKQGKFIRSSDLPISLQKNSLFSYCNAYSGLLEGKSHKQITPILPSYPYNVPAKFVMIPNHNSSLILETSYHLQYIEEILLKTIKENNNIISIGLYSPNNYELGYISKNGQFEQGKKMINAYQVLPHERIFKYRVLANTKECCECTVKGTQYKEGEYYYSLVLRVSISPLLTELHKLRIKILIILLIILIIAFCVSQYIAEKMTRRLNDINESINHIIKTGELSDTSLVVTPNKNTKNEIELLAISFNHMIEQLKVFQKLARESGIAHIAKTVIHNIRSPLLTLEMSSKKLKHILNDSMINLLRNSINDIKALSEKLLYIYRSSSHNINFNGKFDESYGQVSYVTLSSILEEVVALKSIEWGKKPVEIEVKIAKNCSFSWIKAVPADLRAMLSNLMNNAYDALDKPRRKIELSLAITNYRNYCIYIKDNGVGIPESEIEHIRRGKSLKQGGNGVGLSSAIYYIEENFNGKLDIVESVVGVGSIFMIEIPVIFPPVWFSSNITINKNSKVFVLDDDSSMINYWEQRFSEIGVIGHYSSNISSFLNNYEKYSSLGNNVFLIDYELSDEKNGLEIIKDKLCREKNIYLITTYAEEYWIQYAIESIPILMIPKSHINNVQILIS